MKLAILQFKQPHKQCTCGACDAPKPKLPAGMRRLKIQQKFTGVYYDYVPSLLLAGKWLDKIGFKSSYVVVIEEKGKLIISLEE